jgi:DNA polymerase-1
MPPTIYLLDGHALAYRTYYALTRGGLGQWTTRNGEPTAGVYGFASVLYAFWNGNNRNTWRSLLIPAGLFGMIFTRITKAPEPKCLMIWCSKSIECASWWMLSISPDWKSKAMKADDVLGSIAKRAVAEGLGVKIITGDRDLFGWSMSG